MSVALVLDQGELANPRIGLAKLDASRPRQTHQPLAGSMHQPGICREADRLLLHGGIHNDLGEVDRPGGAHADGGCKAFLPSAANFSSPMRCRQRVSDDRSNTSRVLEKLFRRTADNMGSPPSARTAPRQKDRACVSGWPAPPSAAGAICSSPV